MATLHTKNAARAMMAPAVIVLLIWMIVPLAMTLYFSTLNYTLYNPFSTPFVGFENYSYFLNDPTFLAALANTLVLVLGVLAITVGGGILIALGHFTMAFEMIAAFYGGLGLIILGTGMLKPNISVMVGQLYSQEDPRRDAGFTLFYMGINIGAFAAPLICGALAVNYGWHYGFAAAGVGMAIGVIVYLLTGNQLGEIGKLTAEAQAEKAASLSMFWKGLAGTLVFFGGVAGLMVGGVIPATQAWIQGIYIVLLFTITFGLFGWLLTRPYWTDGEKKRLWMIILLFAGYAIFLAAFEQAGSSLNLFTDRHVDTQGVSASIFQSVNAIYIVLLAPLFAILWQKLAAKGAEPSTPSPG